MTEILWTEACKYLQKNMNPNTYDMWIAGIRVHQDANILQLFLRNRFSYEHVLDHYGDLIRQAVLGIAPDTEIQFHIGVPKSPEGNPSHPHTSPAPTSSASSGESSGTSPRNSIEEPNSKKVEGTATKSSRSATRSVQLHDDYVFDNFVVGPNSQFAYTVARRIAEEPSKDHNPFYIYGGTGLGKTHLIQAIAHRKLQKKPSSKIIYVSASELTSQIIQSFRHEKGAHDYKNLLASADMLLLDDIQNIKGPQVINVFFEIFNDLYAKQKQIVITSDVRPMDIHNLDDRIRSRFNGGLIVEVQPPELETRFNILQKKIEIKRADDPLAPVCTMSDSLLMYLAEIVVSNVRDLEGALKLLNAKAEIENVKITQTYIDDVASEHIGFAKRNVNANDIIRFVSNYYHVHESEIRSKGRTRGVVEPRQLVMYLCRELTDLSLPDIGNALGRDHSTILHGCRKIEEKIQKDTMFRSRVESIKRSLQR